MDKQKYWIKKHKIYSNNSWIDEPTIFAKFAIKFFPKKGNLIDLGAGQGQDSRFFSNHGFDVTSVDFNELALRISRQKNSKIKANIKLKKIDFGKELPFENNSFDVVYSHLALHYFDNAGTKKLFNEINRILNKNGIFAAAFNCIKHPQVKSIKKVGNNLFRDDWGLKKRYFSEEYLMKITKDLFELIEFDDKGKRIDDKADFMWFIGKK